MKRLYYFVPFLALVALVLFSPSAAFACPWYDPFCAPTPTPTPTPVLLQKLQVNPNLFQQVVGTTSTPTPAPTSTSTPTPTVSATPTSGSTSTVAPSTTVTPPVNETPVLSPTTEPAGTETPTPKQTKGAGLTNREMLFGGIGVVVLVLLVVTNWGKIKSWLHTKTA